MPSIWCCMPTSTASRATPLCRRPRPRPSAIWPQALLELFEADNEIKIIGTRHGEKLYETLLTREEMAHAEDLGGYYRIPADNRDLNYNKYFVEGEEEHSLAEDYNSHNTERLGIPQIKEKLLGLELVQQRTGVIGMRPIGIGQMKTVLITGAAGFIGKNLVAALKRRDDVRLDPVRREYRSGSP